MTELLQTTDNIEQYSRPNSLRIFRKREESEYEDPAMIGSDVIRARYQPNIKVIDQARRVRKKKQERKASRPILVKFSIYADNDGFSNQRSKQKGTRIFINDDLTQARSALLYKAQTYKRTMKI